MASLVGVVSVVAAPGAIALRLPSVGDTAYWDTVLLPALAT